MDQDARGRRITTLQSGTCFLFGYWLGTGLENGALAGHGSHGTAGWLGDWREYISMVLQAMSQNNRGSGKRVVKKF